MARLAAAGAIVLLILAIPAPALAFVPRGGDTVIINEPLADDLYVGGQTIEIRAPIDGDVVAAGWRVTLEAPVTGAVLAAGGTVGILGHVGRSARVAAGRVSLRGIVDTDAVVVGRQVLTWETTRIGRDFIAAGQRVRMLGVVGRNAHLSGGDVTIGGTISGDVNVTAERLRVQSTARITGKLTYSAAQEADIAPGAQISGGTERRERPQPRRRPVGPFGVPGFRWLSAAAEGVWLLVLGLVAVAISTRGVFAVADRIRRAFWMSLFGGFVLAVVVPVAALILLITVLGVPLGLVALLLYAVTLYPAMIFTAAWLGERIVPRREPGQSPPSPYLTMLVGVVAVAVLIAIPFVGWILRAVAILVGFGALWAKVWAARGVPPAGMPVSGPPPAGAAGGG